MAQLLFLVMFISTTTTRFPTTLITAIHLCEQKGKRLYNISIKEEKITLINTKSIVF